MSQKIVNIYTDGSCLGNPGKGGWAFIIQDENVEISGSDTKTTNNKMEMTAIIQALRYAKQEHLNDRIVIHSDSNYTIKGIWGTNGKDAWIHNWKKKGWITAAKKPVLNKELWIQIDELNDELNVTWVWVKAHCGNPPNERVDHLARTAAELL